MDAANEFLVDRRGVAAVTPGRGDSHGSDVTPLRPCYRSSSTTEVGGNPTDSDLLLASPADQQTILRLLPQPLDHARRHRVCGRGRRVRILEQAAQRGRPALCGGDQVRRLHAREGGAELPRPKRGGWDPDPVRFWGQPRLAVVQGRPSELRQAPARRRPWPSASLRAPDQVDARDLAMHAAAWDLRLSRSDAKPAVQPSRIQRGDRPRRSRRRHPANDQHGVAGVRASRGRVRVSALRAATQQTLSRGGVPGSRIRLSVVDGNPVHLPQAARRVRGSLGDRAGALRAWSEQALR
jgi:hypothetical protein